MSESGARSFWGWGYEASGPNAEQIDGIGATLSATFGVEVSDPVPVPTAAEIELPASRLNAPETLAEICSVEPVERLSHTYGKSYRDVVRALRREFAHPPDVVAKPRSETEVAAVLDWCAAANAAAIPYGAGSSVVGGVEADVGDAYAGAVSIDLSRLDAIVEIDHVSRAARIQAGILGPALEDGLRPHALTLRHYPQSFEFSSLGGWIATRSGGHYATRATHIDDFVESMRVVTPAGVVETRRLPGSGAGPSPDRLFIGSEGSLGIITEAWMRLQDRPVFRASASVRFADFISGGEAARAVVQAGLWPANCRLLDAREAMTSGAGDGSVAVLLLGFESARHPVDTLLNQAIECVRDAVPECEVSPPKVAGPGDSGATRDAASDSWRNMFLNAPYLRDALARLGVISETFETAITWDAFAQFHSVVTERIQKIIDSVCGAGWVACRLTHVYPDGAAPYFTVLAPSSVDDSLEVWDEIKAAAMDVVVDAGGTVTHHHAVGRDHRPGYDRQRPDLFASALTAAKRNLDPSSVLNPGVLID